MAGSSGGLVIFDDNYNFTSTAIQTGISYISPTPYGLNDAGVVIGATCCSPTTAPVFPAFLWTPVTGTVTTFVNGCLANYLVAINDNSQIVGQVDDLCNLFYFYYNSAKGTATYFAYPSLPNVLGGSCTAIGEKSCFFNAIDGYSNFIGDFEDDNQVFHGFVCPTQPPSGQVCTQVDYPGALSTGLLAANNQGQYLGSYEDAQGKWHEFILDNGVFYSAPGGFAINDAAQLAGGSSTPGYGYVYNSE